MKQRAEIEKEAIKAIVDMQRPMSIYVDEKDHSVSNVETRNQKCCFIRTGFVASPRNLGRGWMVKTLENV